MRPHCAPAALPRVSPESAASSLGGFFAFTATVALAGGAEPTTARGAGLVDAPGSARTESARATNARNGGRMWRRLTRSCMRSPPRRDRLGGVARGHGRQAAPVVSIASVASAAPVALSAGSFACSAASSAVHGISIFAA